MKQDNLIHLKFEYKEALDGKRAVLSSQENILRIIQHIKAYKQLRNMELRNKQKIYTKMKALKADLEKLQKTLPKLKIPKILKKETKRIDESKSDVKSLLKYGTVEEQLRVIQKKLKELEEQ